MRSQKESKSIFSTIIICNIKQIQPVKVEKTIKTHFLGIIMLVMHCVVL